jgi:5-methylcytosine-specific restriction endonuclease McrA
MGLKLFCGPRGGLNWDNTRLMFRTNYELLMRKRIDLHVDLSQQKFGSAWFWDTFLCGGQCGGRVLPIDISDLDHVVPQSLFSWSITKPNVMMLRDSVRSDGFGHWEIDERGSIIISLTNDILGFSAYAYAMSADRQSLVVDIARDYGVARNVSFNIEDALINNIDNLTCLCPPCNRSKGNRV